DKSGIIVTILAVVFIHVLVLSLALLPGCSSETQTEYRSETVESTVSDFSFSNKETKITKTAEKPAVEPVKKASSLFSPAPEPKALSLPKPKIRVPLAKQPAPLNANSAVNGRILDLQTWHKKNPRNVSRVCGILIDLNSRKILWQHNAEKAVPIASLTKIMTLMLAYEKLQSPDCQIDLDTEIRITPEARVVPPSGVMFRKEEISFPLRKLMIASAVKSANDATYLIAQTFGNGSADRFVEMMNSRARELGMNRTTYHNPHGLPGKADRKPDNTSSIRDLAILCEAYLQYPELHEWSSMAAATFRVKNDLVNHNRLLRSGKFNTQGVSGIKTGFTLNAGTCLAAYCERNGRRMLAIMTGFNSAADRDTFAKNLLEWGYKK
ncbi:MAG: D-alanyl-D-alanine carboxypeptidase, partial [Lentisphaeria bacterium]|nr:D-alanyl-D-alanine carboxypeptidase [Lentisphaeria bacterium]